ncbi:MAG: SoxR reducing system RseC family protein [Prevotella sp.]|jgi:positive regulator of sigma E activity
MNDTITHSGIIERIEPNHIVVRIAQASGCTSCKIAGQCHASGSKEKLIDVYHVDTSKYQVGEHVVVSASLKTGYKAVVWGFGVPLVILMATLFLVKLWTGNEAQAALTGVAALVPYYFLLYLLREKLRDSFPFVIE